MEKTLLEKVRQNVKEKTKDWNLEEKEKEAYKDLVLQKCDEYIQSLICCRDRNFSEFEMGIYEIVDGSLLEKACEELGFICYEHLSEIFGKVISYRIKIPFFAMEEGKEYTVAQKKYLEYEKALKEAIDEDTKIVLKKCESIKASLEKMDFDVKTFEKTIVLDVHSDTHIDSHSEMFFAYKYFSELGFDFLGCFKEYWRFRFKESIK